MEGLVKFFNESKGYGFINPDEGDKDIFVHVSGLVNQRDLIRENDRVQFDTEDDNKGKGAKAVNVERIN